MNLFLIVADVFALLYYTRYFGQLRIYVALCNLEENNHKFRFTATGVNFARDAALRVFR